ncbi:MAG TPA: hypothetical protein VGC56_06070 [Allosphingosinicella sp.]|jgi:hypothetical protein
MEGSNPTPAFYPVRLPYKGDEEIEGFECDAARRPDRRCRLTRSEEENKMIF